MPRRPLTEAEVARLQAQARGAQRPVERPRLVRRKSLVRTTLPAPVQPLPGGGWLLTYSGTLPRISNKRVHPLAVWRLMKQGRHTFGSLPPMLYPTTRARVEVVRVLGPGQKSLDRDKLALTVAGLIDALRPSFLVDDSEQWADITYHNDATRRQDGPIIEITIRYEEKTS